MTRPTVVVVLVNWKRAADTCACLASLKSQLFANWSAVVCENASPDGSADQIQEYLVSQYPEYSRDEHPATGVRAAYRFYDPSADGGKVRVSLVCSTRNLGFAGGNNLAYRHAPGAGQADFVWFLNNDTEVEPDSLCRLVERAAQDPTVGICGSTLVYAHDRKTVQALGGAVYSPITGAVREIGHGMLWPCSVDRDSVERDMRYVSGASMLATRAFLDRVGLMSEDYFLYYEEIDWAERGRRHGFRLGYAPESVVYHKEGAVLGSGKSSQRSALAEYYGVRNRLLLTRRFFPWALPTVFLFSWAQVGKRLLQGHWRRARMMAAVLLGLRRSAPGL